jgi:hypothetical protein
MRWYQHNYQAIFGRNPRREVKQISPGPHYGGEARICAIGADRVGEISLEKRMGEVLSAQGKEMSEIKVQPSSTLDSNGSHDGGG